MSGRNHQRTGDNPDAPRAGEPGDDGLAADPADEELAVRTIDLDDDEGGTVVIAQQNMAGRRQAGGGEYKNVDHAPSVAEAGAEQELVDASTSDPAPVDDEDPDDPALDAVDEPNRERSGTSTAWRSGGDDTPA